MECSVPKPMAAQFQQAIDKVAADNGLINAIGKTYGPRLTMHQNFRSSDSKTTLEVIPTLTPEEACDPQWNAQVPQSSLPELIENFKKAHGYYQIQTVYVFTFSPIDTISQTVKAMMQALEPFSCVSRNG